jgi:hypothetical protein
MSDLGSDQYNDNADAVQESIEDAQGINDALTQSIAQKNQNLIDKNEINLEQEKAIVDKNKLFLTRSRMLQVSRDKNAYKLKIIYTLLALILLIFTASLGVYIFFRKKGGKGNSGNSK